MDYIKGAFSGPGAFWMWMIILPSIASLSIIIERIIFLLFKFNINATQFWAQVQKLVMANNIDRAIKLCNAAPSAALPRVLKAGLMRANKGEVEISNAIEEAQLDVVPLVMKRTGALPSIASIATLLGLLGTIVGLILAFQAITGAAAEERSTRLAQGIAVAMNTTAFGLIIAIPSLAAYLVLGGVTKKILDEIDQYSAKLENLLVARARGQLVATPQQ
ncbi:MAG: MotA/TolQ/ExbB proton channel family protein [Myxococcota bacterium]|nr:MotA/TolQ/ExbB proton channel family protein [Myxococcota bacterium]